jgi:hypothetical protein
MTMQLSIQSLKDAGAFTGRPVQKDITWKQGDKEITASVFVRPLGYRSAVSDVLATAGRQDGVAGRIASCICDKSGAPVFTVDDITGDADPERGALDGNLTMALMAVIQEVTNMGKTTPSPSSTKPGTKSPSASAQP